MPDRNRNRIGSGPEFEVAYFTKELGKPLQREMLRQRLALLSNHPSAAAGGPQASHGEEAAADDPPAPPAEDRAG